MRAAPEKMPKATNFHMNFNSTVTLTENIPDKLLFTSTLQTNKISYYFHFWNVSSVNSDITNFNSKREQTVLITECHLLPNSQIYCQTNLVQKHITFLDYHKMLQNTHLKI